MYKSKDNINLKDYNTFGVDVTASVFVEFDNEKELIDNITNNNKDKCIPTLILGGGSNILFTKSFTGIVYHPLINKINIIKEDSESVLIKCGCGVVWDDYVKFCVENNFYGLENLSLIPGNVGAAPVQNIGAFGVEVKDFIVKVETINLQTGKTQEFSNKDCQFSYRNSIFKFPENSSKYLITYVTFNLSKKANFTTHYGNIENELQKFDTVNLNNIRQAIINIRQKKLPDPNEIGSAGSFFKNPVISKEKAEIIIKEHPSIPYYNEGNKIKLAAGWMIEQCGWKGYRIGDAGVHKNQALVLVNYGNATGKEILDLSKKIQASVNDKFGILLEPEVRII
ncbi:MAG: UDP-N-acetylmuramate dehydrogenase [Marinilabiliales bacterium]